MKIVTAKCSVRLCEHWFVTIEQNSELGWFILLLGNFMFMKFKNTCYIIIISLDNVFSYLDVLILIKSEIKCEGKSKLRLENNCHVYE